MSEKQENQVKNLIKKELGLWAIKSKTFSV
jgi:hypothetical protein